MKYGQITGIEKQVSRIGQGCMMLNDGDGQEDSNRILDAAWGAGINLFDHSEIYGGGACERAFGVWLTENRSRDEVVILDKCCHPKDGKRRVNPETMRADLEISLERLQTDYVDLFLFHRDDPEVPVGPLVETFNELKDAGKINAFGGSNWTHNRVQEANDYAASHGLAGFSASSPNYSLAEQVDSPWGPDCITISGRANAAAREWYQRSGISVMAWSSLARGFLSGRMNRTNFEQVKGDFEDHTIRCYVTDDNWTRLERADELGKEKGLSIPQIAVAFVLHQPMDVFALVGAFTKEETDANNEALATALSQTELDWLDLKRDAR